MKRVRGIDLADIDRAVLCRRPVSLLVRPIVGWSPRWHTLRPLSVGASDFRVYGVDGELYRRVSFPSSPGEDIVGRESTYVAPEGQVLYRSDLRSCQHPQDRWQRFTYEARGRTGMRKVDLCAGCWSRGQGWPRDMADHRDVVRVEDIPVLPGWTPPAKMRPEHARWRFRVLSVEARHVQSITNDEALAAGFDCEGDDFATHWGDFRSAWWDRWKRTRHAWEADPWCWFVRVDIREGVGLGGAGDASHDP